MAAFGGGRDSTRCEWHGLLQRLYPSFPPPFTTEVDSTKYHRAAVQRDRRANVLPEPATSAVGGVVFALTSRRSGTRDTTPR